MIKWIMLYYVKYLMLAIAEPNASQVLILVFQLLLCSVDDTGNITVSNKPEKIIISEVHYDNC